MPQGLDRGQAAARALLASVGRVRCAKRLVAVTRAALVVQRASRVPGVIGLRRAVRRRTSAHLMRWTPRRGPRSGGHRRRGGGLAHVRLALRRCFRAHMFRRGASASRTASGRPRSVGQEAARGVGQEAGAPARPQRGRALAARPGARGGAQARKARRRALAGALLAAEEKRLQRKKRREAEQQRARENEKRRKNDRKGWLEKRAAANRAADAAADALWATLARSEACAAIVIKGARGPRAEKVNGLYRASRKATRPPLFSSKGAHLFVAKKEGTWAWILGDWSAYEASEARGWATSTTVCVGAPPCGKPTSSWPTAGAASSCSGYTVKWSRRVRLRRTTRCSAGRAAAAADLRPRATRPAGRKTPDAPGQDGTVRQAAAARASRPPRRTTPSRGPVRWQVSSDLHPRSARKMVAKARMMVPRRKPGATSRRRPSTATRMHERQDRGGGRETENSATSAANCAVDLIADDIMEALVGQRAGPAWPRTRSVPGLRRAVRRALPAR